MKFSLIWPHSSAHHLLETLIVSCMYLIVFWFHVFLPLLIQYCLSVCVLLLFWARSQEIDADSELCECWWNEWMDGWANARDIPKPNWERFFDALLKSKGEVTEWECGEKKRGWIEKKWRKDFQPQKGRHREEKKRKRERERQAKNRTHWKRQKDKNKPFNPHSLIYLDLFLSILEMLPNAFS